MMSFLALRDDIRLELGVADTKEGMDLLEQSMEKAVEDLKVQIQDLEEGIKSSSIHAVSHEEFVTFQDRVLSMLAGLESRVEVLTKHKEKLRQEVAIYKTALSVRVMATHEAPRGGGAKATHVQWATGCHGSCRILDGLQGKHVF